MGSVPARQVMEAPRRPCWRTGGAKIGCPLTKGSTADQVSRRSIERHDRVTRWVATIDSRPWFALPDPRFLSYRFQASLMLPFAIAALASGLRVIGVITTCQKINDASWGRPDLVVCCRQRKIKRRQIGGHGPIWGTYPAAPLSAICCPFPQAYCLPGYKNVFRYRSVRIPQTKAG